MDQLQLREVEARCIQEEQPFCTAACPIHVDVRGFMAALAKDDVRGARRILDRTMPFPEIVGRLCDAPCHPFCKRSEIGDPLATGSLERYCVSRSTAVLKLPKLPAKSGRIAVVGNGLSAMTVSLDLARKGRSTTIITQIAGLGGTLRDYAEDLLPGKTLVDAEEILKSYDVTLQTGTMLTEKSIASLITEYDAVYFDLDEITQDQLPVHSGQPDPQTLALTHDGCFAGGGVAAGSTSFSVIKQVEDGRRAALTIERYLQKVSLTAQRDMEGARTTRMYTVTAGIEPAAQKVPADPTVGYTSDEARQEAGRCIQCECLECVKQCVYLQEYKEYPKTLIRKVYNNQAIVQGTRSANKMINSCSLCTQCTTICPNDFPVAEICRTSRREMVRDKHMPASAHEFALEDMAFSLSEFCALSRHQPGTAASRFLFYPGCQLAGSAPEAVKSCYQFLCNQMTGGVGLMLGCCGIPAHWAGQEKLFAETMDHFTTELKRLGNPTVITACSSCLSIFREFAGEIEVVSLWEVLDTLQLPIAASKTGPRQPLTIHDPCTARHQAGLRASVRNICAKLGLTVMENDFSGELTDCCGYGGLMQFANQTLGDKAAQVKAGRSEHAGLAYCAMCRDNLAAAGSPAAHLLDYIFAESCAGDPLKRNNPGFSARHENRARLKEQLLGDLWQEAADPLPEHKKIRLVMNQKVLDLLNKRHILEEDIQKVILSARQTGKHMVNPDNNHHLASCRPVRVTYWVEYEATDQGYVIHNAYSHRMQLPEVLS